MPSAKPRGHIPYKRSFRRPLRRSRSSCSPGSARSRPVAGEHVETAFTAASRRLSGVADIWDRGGPVSDATFVQTVSWACGPDSDATSVHSFGPAVDRQGVERVYRVRARRPSKRLRLLD